MWSRKKLKDSAKKKVMKNYWLCIAACFILAFFTSDYSSSLYIIRSSNSEDTRTEDVVQSYSIKSSLDYAFGENFLNIDNDDIAALIDTQINSISQSHTYIYKFVGIINRIINRDLSNAVIYLIYGLFEFLYTIFIANLLIVGVRKLFIENSNESNDKIELKDFTSSFRGHHIVNIAYIMFCRMIFYVLWSLTIIGVFIKMYEYRMIPFILAEHPEMKRKDVFALSRKMMHGNKWNSFILDISFIGWHLLSIITFGLSSIFYFNSYHLATYTELYNTLKEDTIK